MTDAPRPPLPIEQTSLGLALFLADLETATSIDEIAYTEWLHRNIQKLAYWFYTSNEPLGNETEDAFGIWARKRFLAETRHGMSAISEEIK